MDQDESWFNDGFDFTRAEAFQDLDDDDHQQQLDITDALSVSRVSDTFDPSKTYTYDNITAPVDDHSLRYLESRSLTATELSMLSKWEDEYLKQSFPKFSFVSHVYSRDPLPVGLYFTTYFFSLNFTIIGLKLILQVGKRNGR